jgi:hypothetical protein
MRATEVDGFTVPTARKAVRNEIDTRLIIAHQEGIGICSRKLGFANLSALGAL